MFAVKMFLKGWLYPLPLSLLIVTAGVVLLWIPRRQRLGRILTTTGAGLLLLFSLGFWSHPLLRAYEHTYPPYAAQAGMRDRVKWVVVLSGGYTDEAGLPANSRVTPIGLARLLEGLRVLRLHPNARLLLSGGSPFPNMATSEARLDREVATMCGVDPARIVIEEKARDTEEQAAAVKAMIGQEPLVLVTSAVHLPRSMKLFRAQGMSPLPAPAGYLATRDQHRRVSLVQQLRPSSGMLNSLTAASHEWIGIVWSKLRGKG